MLKLYCYTDETGQDTKGNFFLVSIVLASKDELEKLKTVAEHLEKKTKGKSKWTNTDNQRKVLFVKEVVKIKALYKKVYFSVYQGSSAYTPLTAMSIGKAVMRRVKNKGIYRVNIIIDGLNKRESEVVKKELKSLGIRYGKLKTGLKDDQDVLLRLADALAGLIRDCIEDQKYLDKTAGIKKNFMRLFIEV